MSNEHGPWTWVGVTNCDSGWGHYCVAPVGSDKQVCIISNQPLSVARLIAAAPALLKVAEAVEWMDVAAGQGECMTICPWCENEKHEGHAPDCIRQAAIAQARGGE